jgi:hypothetical protein
MRPNQLILRCYAERDGGLWVAVCLDLSLAAQGDSMDEARAKLDDQIRDYVRDALGVDRKHAAALLAKRKAPVSEWMRYYRLKFKYKLKQRLHSTKALSGKPFREVMPVELARC